MHTIAVSKPFQANMNADNNLYGCVWSLHCLSSMSDTHIMTVYTFKVAGKLMGHPIH